MMKTNLNIAVMTNDELANTNGGGLGYSYWNAVAGVVYSAYTHRKSLMKGFRAGYKR